MITISQHEELEGSILDRQKVVHVLCHDGATSIIHNYGEMVYWRALKESDMVYSLWPFSNLEFSSCTYSECEYNARVLGCWFLLLNKLKRNLST